MSDQPTTFLLSFRCKRCGKEFSIDPRQLRTAAGGGYCSKECRYPGHVTLTCQGCGKTFPSSASLLRKGRKYCSRACRPLRPQTQRTRVTLACLACGEQFICTGYQARRGKKYCSKACANQNNTLKMPANSEPFFWPKVHKTDSCWLWTASTDGHGYGWFHGRINGKYTTRAHIFAYLLLVGDIEDGLCVCHNCPGGDNPLCVNPAHLFLGTKADNQLDMARKARNQRVRKLNDNQVKEIRSRYADGVITQKQLASDYGVTKQTILSIINYKSYKHVP